MDRTSGEHPAPPPMAWRDRIDSRIVAGFVLLLLLISTALGLYLWTKGRRALTDESYRLHEQAGNTLVSNLEQELAWAEGLVTALAEFASSEPYPLDLGHLREVIPSMLRQQGNEDFVAGGGVWPEPNRFVPGVDRASLFWGRNPSGEMVFYDDYNDRNGPGYHREEWYVPAKRLRAGQVYWSKTYMDPYTFQPMVTCTAPMLRGGEFIGVATVDLKLEGIREIVASISRRIHGYAFILDRNDTFVCYPDDVLVQHVTTDISGQAHRDFLSARDFAIAHPEFAPVAQAVERIDQRSMDQTRPGDDAGLVARSLVLESDAIGAAEALRIVAMFRERERSDPFATHLRERMTLDEDTVFDETVTASVFFMPRTFWKVVTVTPREVVISGATRMIREFSLFALLLIVVAALGAWLWVRRHVVDPLQAMARDLRRVSESGDAAARLSESQELDELALLAYWFNQRTALLDEARRAAEETNASRNEFLARTSHEIRGPLTDVLRDAEVLLDRDTPPHRHQECAADIRERARSVLRLIDDIGDLVRLESGRLPLNPTDVALRELVDDVWNLMEPRAREVGSTLVVESGPGLPSSVITDPMRVRQVLINLIEHAIRSTDAGSVTLRARSDGAEDGTGRILFTVSDRGVGMTEQQMTQVFEPFARANASFARHGATGLGLGIARRLARRLGGDVTVTSHPGQGTCRSFSLDPSGPRDSPAPPAPGALLASSPSLLGHAGATGPRARSRIDAHVLVADDMKAARDVLRTLLREAGATVEEVDNGKDALDRVIAGETTGRRFDVVLMDVRMPEMDGCAATQRLRAAGYAGCIIGCSAQLNPDDERRCVAAGCDDWVRKPVDPRVLLDRIAHHLATRSPASSAR